MHVESEFQNATLGQQTWRYHDSGQGRAVVLIHGFPDLPHSYAIIARALNDAGYRTILPYLRGYHPDTIVPGRPYDAVSIAEDAIGLLDALGLSSAVLVGHDWGASVVWGAAAIGPERVEAIVPIAIPHPETLRPKNALEAVGALVLARHFVFFKTPWADAMTRRDDFAYIDTLYKRWSPDWRGPERDAALERIKSAFRNPEVLKAAIDYYRAVSTRIDPRLIGQLRCRGLMVAGGKDFGGHIGPYKKSAGLFEGGADLWVVPNAGHWPHREEQALFIDRLLAFLGERA
ncbi:MAG: alpha/beta hydrolase [Myxococcales bacterium]|nr:alpha/beta hydrolase [Myxococcales bacterium]MDH3485207.1 alpha/beta hydrolase [Myxococcales bacterium]